MNAPAVTHLAAPVAGGSLMRLPRLSHAAMALAALFVVGLALRLAELDRIPLDEREAGQALAAWNLLHPREAVALRAPQSPLLLALQTLLFSLFGANELTARLPVALAGAALPFTPLLFRKELGRGRCHTFCLLLAASPLLLMASRQAHAAVLSLALATLMLWGLLRFLQRRRPLHAMTATLAAAMLILLAEAGGILLALQLGLALLFARRRRRDGKWSGPRSTLRQWARVWPLAETLPPALLAVFLIATLFMLHPPGLANVGELPTSLVTGFGDSPATLLPANGLATGAPAGLGQVPFDFLQGRLLNLVLLFEPFVVVTGLLWFWLRGRHRSGAVDRFLFIWLLAALASLWLWRGASPAHTLWLIVPLAGLAGGMLADLLFPQDDADASPPWAIALAAATGFCLSALFSFYARLLLRDRVDESAPVLALALLPLVALIVLRRGGAAALMRGAAAGALAFILLLSLGGGWAAAVTGAEEADGLWRRAAPSTQTWQLRATLQDLANRKSGGFTGLKVQAWRGERTSLRWLLRDYPRLQFVDGVANASAADVLLLPASMAPPGEGDAWISREFVLRRRRVAAVDAGTGIFPPAGLTSPQASDSLLLLVRRAGDEAQADEAVGDAAP